METGTLYLIPTTLGATDNKTIPTYVIERIHQLDYFIVERAKTARRFIKSTEIPRAIQELQIFELDKHQPKQGIKEFIVPLLQGNDMGLLSEAGCPGVADPGAEVVALAHQQGIKVYPMVGPSSFLLALMASGLNGQSFCFHGYLSAKKEKVGKDLKQLEQLALRHHQTQLFMEAPYRNDALIKNALKIWSPSLRLCIAMDITLSTQFIETKTVAQWQKSGLPNMHKRPAVFLIGR